MSIKIKYYKKLSIELYKMRNFSNKIVIFDFCMY